MKTLFCFIEPFDNKVEITLYSKKFDFEILYCF